MLLSKAIALTDTVTETVTAHLPGPLATPVQLAVSTLTWAPRHLVGDPGRQGSTERSAEQAASGAAEPQREAAPTDQATDQATDQEGTEPREPEVVLTLDRPAEQVEPPVDVVGDALRSEAAEPAPAHEDEDHVEVEEQVVFSSGPDSAR